MRRWIALAESLEILRRGLSAKGVVRSVVESVGEGIDESPSFVAPTRQRVGSIDLIAPCGLGGFDAAVEVCPLRRQDKEFEAALFAFLLENRIELAAAIDLNAANGERRFHR